MKSTGALTAREATAAVVVAACVLVVSLSTASGQDVGRCDPSSVTQCYMMYMTVLWAEDYRPTHEYDEEQLKRSCSAIEEKLPCHRYLVNCSEAVTGAHSIEERGYEALRNIMCGVKKLKETYIAAKCVNVEKIRECTRKLMPTPNPLDAEEPPDPTSLCNINAAEIDCFDQAFNSSCTLSMTMAKAAMTRVGHAAVLLRGCESSANAVVVSRSFLVLLLVPIVLSWLKT